MKKIAYLGAVFVATSLLGDRSLLDETKTRAALPLSEPPQIDGIIDLAGGESWVWAGGAAGRNWRVQFDENAEDFFRGGAPSNPNAVEPFDNTDLNFDIYVGFDEDNLYVAIRVVDDWVETDSAEAESEDGQTWQDDSVEIFVDGNNSNFAERNTSDPDVIETGGQFVISANNAFRDNEAGNPGYGENESWFARTDLTDNGYDAEFRISLDILGNPKPGDIIGFTIAVNDDDDGGNAERQILWAGSPHTEHTYGNLVLGGFTYIAPKSDSSNSPTLDGMIEAGEYGDALPVIVNRFTGIYNIPAGDDSYEEGDHEYTYRVTHDADAIYVGFEVIDEMLVSDSAEAGSEDGQTWIDDSLEIFFDADDSNDAGRGDGEFEGQYVLTINGAWRDNEANNPMFGENGDWFAVTQNTEEGYNMEFRVNKSALFNPEDGVSMGFNIALNDDDGNNRETQLNWSGRPHSEFTYGTLILEGESISPEPEPAPSIRVSRNEDGSLVIEFEGILQTALDVAGPYVDVAAESPIVLSPDQAKQFARARQP